MNLRFSSSKTLKVDGLEILDEEVMVFSSKTSIEEDEEEKEKEYSCIEGSRFPKMLGFAEFKEAEDMENIEKIA